MDKKIRKLLANGQLEIGKTESWLQDMASEGFHLKKMGSIFADFDKGEPRNINYRIDIIERKNRSEKIKFHENNGWKLVSNLNDLHIFSSNSTSGLKELYEDPKNQLDSISYLYRKSKISFIVGIIAFILFMGMMMAVLLLKNTYLMLVDGYVINQILLLLFQMYVFYSIFKSYFLTKKLKRIVDDGKWINHREPYKKNRKALIAFYALYFPLLIVTACLPFLQIAKNDAYTLESAKEIIPAVRLCNIEESDIDFSNEKSSNQVLYSWSLLAPAKYEIEEYGEIPELMWNDGSGKYSPSIHTKFYKLSFSFMSKGLVEDLIDRYVWRDEEEAVKMASDYFDALYIAENRETKQVFAYKDNYVISVRYYGYVSVEELEKHIVDEMKKL